MAGDRENTSSLPVRQIIETRLKKSKETMRGGTGG